MLINAELPTPWVFLLVICPSMNLIQGSTNYLGPIGQIWPHCLTHTHGHFPGGSVGKESACNAGDTGSIPGQEDPLEKGMAIHSRILAWRIPWTDEPGGLQSMGSQTVRHDWSDWALIGRTPALLFAHCLWQGSPTPGPQTGTGPWLVRNWSAQQDVGGRWASEVLSVFTATIHHSHYFLSSASCHSSSSIMFS